MFKFGNPLGSRILSLGLIAFVILIMILGNVLQFLFDNWFNFLIIGIIIFIVKKINDNPNI